MVFAFISLPIIKDSERFPLCFFPYLGENAFFLKLKRNFYLRKRDHYLYHIYQLAENKHIKCITDKNISSWKVPSEWHFVDSESICKPRVEAKTTKRFGFLLSWIKNFVPYVVFVLLHLDLEHFCYYFYS